MLYSGIDLHKCFVLITVINESGCQISQVRINNDVNALISFFAQFNEPIEIVVEATLNWYWLVDLLDNLGYTIVLAHPKKLKAIVDTKFVDDKISSETLAQLLRNNYIPKVYYLNPGIRALRDLCRTRLYLVRQRTSLVNGSRSTLLKYNLFAPAKGKLYSPNGLAYLRKPDLAIHDIYKFGLNCRANIIELLTENIDHLEQEIKRNMVTDEIIELLKSISGIGDVLAPTIRYEIGDMSRFYNEKRLSSYCRFTPRTHRSAKRTKQYKTSKDGNAYLKWAFSEVTVNAIRYDSDVKRRYQRLKSKKGKPVALTIIGRNMTTIVYNVWTKREPYRGFKKPKIETNKEQ